MTEVDKLVEWVAMEVAGHVHIDWDELSLDGKEHCSKLARKILSHPDLALIDRAEHTVCCPFCEGTGDDRNDTSKECRCCHGEGLTRQKITDVIPLAEALKEVKT